MNTYDDTVKGEIEGPQPKLEEMYAILFYYFFNIEFIIITKINYLI